MNLEDAIVMAAAAHAGVRDKQGQPYILHPLRAMLSLAKQRAPLEAQVAAVLHDVVEVTLDDIAAQFGYVVAGIVDAVSRRSGEVYVEFIHRAAENPLARMVKRADLIDNLSRPVPPDMVGIEKRYKRALGVLDAAGVQ
ncbi:MAG: HD domain-containing protein [Myxococcales bacterium]|nr:HD domain-containing protein [Myxococcales bacterium]